MGQIGVEGDGVPFVQVVAIGVAEEGDAPMHEPGSRETAVVLEGELILSFEGERHSLDEGDSVTFDADLPHHFENESDSPTRFVAVIAAGLRRG